jgi:hypothetical protein
MPPHRRNYLQDAPDQRHSAPQPPQVEAILALGAAIAVQEERRREQLDQLGSQDRDQDVALQALGRTEQALAVMRGRQAYLRIVARQ